LFELIKTLPKLISLQLHSLSLNEANDVTDYYRAVSIYPRGDENKIDAIYIEEINHIEEFNSMSHICPNMKYFKVKHIYIYECRIVFTSSSKEYW
jgi:hypothetical protein